MAEVYFGVHQPGRGQMEKGGYKVLEGKVGGKALRQPLRGTDLRCMRLTWCWDITLMGGNGSD